jgi:hypothetical protein
MSAIIGGNVNFMRALPFFILKGMYTLIYEY